MPTQQQITAILAAKGITILPPLTDEQRLAKHNEVLARSYRNAPKQVRDAMTEAEVIERFYAKGNKFD